MMIRRGQRHCAVIRPSIRPTVRLSFHSFIRLCTDLFVYFRVIMCVYLIYAIRLFPYLFIYLFIY